LKGPAPKLTEIHMDELDAIVDRAANGPLSEQDRAKLKAAMETLAFLAEQIEGKTTSIERLRRILFGPKTEKTKDVCGGGGSGAAAAAAGPKTDGSSTSTASGKTKPKGHGRNGAASYTGADKVRVPHNSLKHGESCPRCKKGKVYRQAKPCPLVRVVGRAPLHATVYELERLRCNLCGDVYTAPPPEGVGDAKYDPSAAAMLALLKYGTGMPFYRLAGLEGSLGIPLPPATQWEIVKESASPLRPVLEEHIRQAAQGDVLHNDDTKAIILEWLGSKRPRVLETVEGKEDERTGLFTSGIVSEVEGHRIALYFTGMQHAGENLADVLKKRAKTLPPPIQMCDALSRNLPKSLQTTLANCLTHGRRQFVDVAERFPDECRHVLEELGVAYKNDDRARALGLSPEERLRFHQRETGPTMVELKAWLEQQLEQRKVEPNSGLGQAIKYMVKHWDKLTLFLRVAGAPIDNNICERALKRVVLYRKNALFYKTKNGAQVGDLFMSLIHTAELAKADPFHYLSKLLEHAPEIAQNPERWMPWNYKDALPKQHDDGTLPTTVTPPPDG